MKHTSSDGTSCAIIHNKRIPKKKLTSHLLVQGCDGGNPELLVGVSSFVMMTARVAIGLTTVGQLRVALLLRLSHDSHCASFCVSSAVNDTDCCASCAHTPCIHKYPRSNPPIHTLYSTVYTSTRSHTPMSCPYPPTPPLLVSSAKLCEQFACTTRPLATLHLT